jgi:NAD(P)-dependent dehydrogenase (short-subunit alcohol dehydrogenase family)
VLLAVIAGCGGHAFRTPDDVQGYEIVVTGDDSVSRAFARELANEGFRVRNAVRGGNRPAAVLVHFVFHEPNGPTLLHGRLADTRSGAIVAAASIPLDSTSRARRDSVPALVRSLTAKGT